MSKRVKNRGKSRRKAYPPEHVMHRRAKRREKLQYEESLAIQEQQDAEKKAAEPEALAS